jgi:hypothetical protein
MGTVSDRVSSDRGQVGGGIAFGLEQLCEAGADLATEDDAADLERKINTAS